jgi:hypothetical protein
MTTVIDTPQGIAYFHMLQLMHALDLEVKHPGLKMSRGSVMKQVNKEYGTTFTRKAQALEFMREKIKEVTTSS